jgi:toxin CcdB
MARFDVYKTAEGQFVLDCQADLLHHLDTRFVLPLLAMEPGAKIAQRLNPVFVIDGGQYVLYPQFAASLTKQELGTFILSLDREHIRIMDAIDMLITGY